MTIKLVEILTIIYEAIAHKHTLAEINTELQKNKEFDEQSISAAFSILFDNIIYENLRNIDTMPNRRKFRILSEEEKDKIGIDNYNYLMKLDNIGLLDNLDFEEILNQLIILSKTRLSKDDINFIVLLSLVDIEKSLTPGSRMILFSSDTIN